MSHLSTEETAFLKDKAKQIRIDILKMITKANSGHTGGSLSIADLLTLLYFKEMHVDPANPHKADRDRLVLSKGHAAPAMYACLAEKGYFPKEELDHLRQAGHMLQGHPDMKHTPGVDMTTGSLGQGISAACGMALASKIDKADWRVYAVLGDGELEEGQVWEDKFRAFGGHVIETDGHDVEKLHEAIEEAKSIEGKPTMIVMKTVKGKGVPEIENKVGWHGKAPTEEECARFIKQVEAE